MIRQARWIRPDVGCVRLGRWFGSVMGFSGKSFSPRASLRLALPILAGIPRNAPMPAGGRNSPSSHFRARHSGASAPIPSRVRSLRSETAWFTRYRPSLAIRRPSATIRQDRSPSQATVATPTALPRYHLRRLLPSLTAVACTSLPHLRAERSRYFEGSGQPGCALRVSDTLRRRWASKAAPRGLPDYCSCAGWQSSARAPPPVRASRYGSTNVAD